MELYDTHAHLNDPGLVEMGASLFAAANEAGVKYVNAIGIDLRSSLQCVEIAECNAGTFASVGVHPNSCHKANDFQWDEIKALVSHGKVVALGETGLDCYWDDCPLELQQQWFPRHIQLSHETGLPIVVHQRESETQIMQAFERLHDSGKINGVMHSYTGTWEAAQTCLDYGMYISFAGMVTFKNAKDIQEIARQVPEDRILIETDSPYLTPAPHRGKRPNQPAMVAHTAKFIADLRGVDIESFANTTTENAKRVFKIA